MNKNKFESETKQKINIIYDKIKQKAESRWREIINNNQKKIKSAKKAKKIFLIGSTLSGLASLAGLAIMIISLPCLSIPVIPAIAIGTLTASATSGIEIGGGALITGGGVYGMYRSKKTWNKRKDIGFDKNTMKSMQECIEKTRKIRTVLCSMLMARGVVNRQLVDMDNIRDDNMSPWMKNITSQVNMNLNNTHSIKSVREGVENLSKYVVKYQTSGKKLIQDITEVEKMFIDIWANMKL